MTNFHDRWQRAVANLSACCHTLFTPKDDDDPWAWLYKAVDHRGPDCIDNLEIEGYRQNNIRFVVRDAARILSLTPYEAAQLARILVARGVAKWLRARRSITKLKHRMRRDLTRTQQRLADGTAAGRTQWLRGWMAATCRWREELRHICRTPRYVLGADHEDAQFVAVLFKYGLTDNERRRREQPLTKSVAWLVSRCANMNGRLEILEPYVRELTDAAAQDPELEQKLVDALKRSLRNTHDGPCGVPQAPQQASGQGVGPDEEASDAR